MTKYSDKIIESLNKNSEKNWFDLVFCKFQMKYEGISQEIIFDLIGKWSSEKKFVFQKIPEYRLIISSSFDGVINVIPNDNLNLFQVIFISSKIK